MPAAPERTSLPAGDLDTAADQAIAACGGDAREAVKALIVANNCFGSATGGVIYRWLSDEPAGVVAGKS